MPSDFNYDVRRGRQLHELQPGVCCEGANFLAEEQIVLDGSFKNDVVGGHKAVWCAIEAFGGNLVVTLLKVLVSKIYAFPIIFGLYC